MAHLGRTRSEEEELRGLLRGESGEHGPEDDQRWSLVATLVLKASLVARAATEELEVHSWPAVEQQVELVLVISDVAMPW